MHKYAEQQNLSLSLFLSLSPLYLSIIYHLSIDQSSTIYLSLSLSFPIKEKWYFQKNILEFTVSTMSRYSLKLQNTYRTRKISSSLKGKGNQPTFVNHDNKLIMELSEKAFNADLVTIINEVQCIYNKWKKR